MSETMQWQDQLLSTKFFVPASTHTLISRPRLTAFSKALRKNARSNDTFSRRRVYQIGCKSKIAWQDALINSRSWPILMTNSKDFCDDLP